MRIYLLGNTSRSARCRIKGATSADACVLQNPGNYTHGDFYFRSTYTCCATSGPEWRGVQRTEFDQQQSKRGRTADSGLSR